LPQYRNGGYTPLMFAARSGDIEAARLLLAAGANIDEPTGSGATPLVTAAHAGLSDFGIFLLNRGADPNLAKAGYTALHAAILRGSPDLVKALLAHGADANALIKEATPVGRSSDDYAVTLQLIGATPFWQAASYNDLESMTALVAAGANARSTTADGKTALAVAIQTRGRDRGRAELQRVPDESAILEAVKLAVAQHVDINAIDERLGNTPLHLAAARGYSSIVQFLVDSGADLQLMNYSAQTPLMAAMDAGRRGAKAAELLRKLGATEY
jgi:ankyrin repeat protein